MLYKELLHFIKKNFKNSFKRWVGVGGMDKKVKGNKWYKRPVIS